jgi:prepilin-type N-terminal cleavage/methylation domain-containing protein
MLRLGFSQAGDTIVEVLVAMAVLGVVLTGAFVTANSSLNGEHTAQEHAQALTIAQSQIEDLVAGYNLVGNCFNPQNPNLSVGAGNCYFDNAESYFCLKPYSSQCAQSAAYWYQISDTAIPASLPTAPAIHINTYKIVVSWPSLSGGTGSVQLYYRPQ